MDGDDAQGDNLEALYAISEIASKAQDLPGLWGPLLEKVLAVLKVVAGTLMILEGDCLIRKASRGLGEEIMEEQPIPSSSGGVSWKAVQTKVHQVVTDIQNEKIASKTLAEAGFRSLVTVPLLVRDQPIGVMSIFTRKERQFSEKDLNFFVIIANQAALAIISLRSGEILAENRRRLAELEALNQISKSVSTLFDFEETLYSIIASITKTLRGEKGLLALFNHDNHLLEAASPAFGLTAIQVRDFRLRNDEAVTGEAFCKGVPIMMGKLNPATEEVLRRAKISNVKSVLAAPLKVKSQTLGVIQIFSGKENNFRFEDLRLFNILASQAAVVVNSSSMYRQIEEERKKDEALLASIGEGVLAIDKDQKIIHLNRAGENITGFLAEELLGEIFQTALGLWNRDKQAITSEDSPINQVLKDGQSVVLKDYYLKKRSGGLFPAYLTASAIYDVDDRIIGAIVTFRDISTEHELEEMKQELVSIATHELRAPITAIKGYLDMILTGDTGGVKGETQETLQEVAKINQRLADLVDDLLNVGRIDQGRMTVRPQEINLGDLISQTVLEYQPQAQEKQLLLTYSQGKIPLVKADPARVHQILSNLISNAIKYTEKGSVEITVETKGKEIICEVKDTGVGVSPAAQKRLFEKFYRVKTPQTQLVTGTGLGLWITKRLVEMNAGKIWLESAEGKGTSFYFSLPKA